MTDETEQRAAMSRDPEARVRTASPDRILRLRSAEAAMATSQVVAMIAVAALALVIVVPHTANGVRVVVTFASVVLIGALASRGGAGWLAVTIPAVILWNPIWPVYLQRSTWVVIDIVFGGLLLGLTVWCGLRRASIHRKLLPLSADRRLL